MRDIFYCTQDVLIRERFHKMYKIADTLIIFLGVLCVVYFLFWIGASCDSYFLNAGRGVFEPLAKFLNNGANNVDIYLNTSKITLFSVFAMFVFRIVLNSEEKKSLNEYIEKEEKRKARERLDIQKTCVNTHEGIKTYSICLSIDYESNDFISLQKKVKFSNLIYEKIAKTLTLIERESCVSSQDVLIFTASNFMNYDKIYDEILKELSLIKKIMKNKHNIKIIPSITTDAFTTLYNIDKIKKQHFEIKTFNFKNRSLTTAAFLDKYKYLRQSKYIGTPIGEYVYFNDEETGTYELNVVHKNLEKILS